MISVRERFINMSDLLFLIDIIAADIAELLARR